jgi:zinc protease
MPNEHTRRSSRRRPLACLALIWALALSVVAGCAPSASPDRQWPQIDLSFEKYTLDNGLEVILREDDRVPVAAVNLWYHVGPANEVAGRTGFAHLFEHMMFQGSGHTDPDSYFPHLESVGGTGINAGTNFDYTDYTEDVPSNALETALWLESDRMGFLLDTLDQAQLANQQSVVRNERRETTESTPYGLSGEAIYQQLFPEGHPYHAAIIGSHEDIQAATLVDVRDFFRRYYVPNNASLAIVGDIDPAATKVLIQKYFGSIPRGADVRAPQVDVPQPTSERRLTVTDQVELPAVTMSWVTPTAFAPGDAEAGVAAAVLGGGKTSRLYEALVHRTRIAQDVSASQESLGHGSVFTITATAAPGHTADELEASVQRELDAFAAKGPTQEELAAVETMIRSGTVFGLEQPATVADQLNRYNHYLGDPGYLNKDLQRYADVTTEGVTRFAEAQLTRDRRLVVHTVPGTKVLPPDPPVPAQTEVEAPAPVPSAEPWRSTVPPVAPGPAPSLPEAQRFELANGLPVYLVERHGLPLAAASLVSRWGAAADPPDRSGLAEFSADMLDEGTQTRDALGIAREIEALGASLSTSADGESSRIDAAAPAPQLGGAMAVMSDVARAPAFPPGEVERVRGELLTGLAQRGDDPSAIASSVITSELYGEQHAYGRTGADTAAGLAAITRDDLQRFHQQAFSPATSALILAGDLTVDQARTLAEAQFGSWRGTGTAPPPAGPPVPSPERVFVVDHPGSNQTTLELAQPGISIADPDYVALTVLDAVLGGGFSSRINLNLRERNGYAYGAFSSVSAGRGVGLITLDANVQTRYTGASVRELLDEVTTLRNAPVTDDELSLAKESLGQSLPLTFSTVASAAGTISGLYLSDLPPDYYRKLPDALAGISAADVQAVARARLQPDQMKVVAVGDRAELDGQLGELQLGPIAYRKPDGTPAPAV